MTKTSVMTSSVESFFEQYRSALLSFSAEEISAHYHNPVAIYSDQGVQVVDNPDDTLAFWKKGVEPYKKMAIVRSDFEILNEEKLSESQFFSKVLWKNYDASGKEVARETNFYILTKKGEDFKISGLVLTGK